MSKVINLGSYKKERDTDICVAELSGAVIGETLTVLSREMMALNMFVCTSKPDSVKDEETFSKMAMNEMCKISPACLCYLNQVTEKYRASVNFFADVIQSVCRDQGFSKEMLETAKRDYSSDLDNLHEYYDNSVAKRSLEELGKQLKEAISK